MAIHGAYIRRHDSENVAQAAAEDQGQGHSPIYIANFRPIANQPPMPASEIGDFFRTMETAF
jgi:hypothetical protein